jgi:hypothetical protein
MPRPLPALAAVLLLLVSAGPPPIPAADEIERNWAREGKATQSSVTLGGEAARAIDGNRNGNWGAGSVTHTAQENEPYWQVDLGAAHYIDEIRIYNRTDCCGERLKQVMVFWVNNTTGFAARDIATLMGENTSDKPATAVYFKPFFHQAGDPDPVTGKPGPVTTIRLTGNDCGLDGQPGCLMRFVRIQLAGEGPLSLAEVEIVEKGRIEGPALVDDAVTWAPTGITSTAPGVAMATLGERILLYYRGSDGLLHASDHLAEGPAAPGSPTLSAEAPAAALSATGDRAYVAVRTSAGAVAIAEGDPSAGGLGGPVWATVGEAGLPPSVASGCGRAVAAWTDRGRLLATWKSVGDAPGSGWSAATIVSRSSASVPALAVNSRGDIGVAFVGPGGAINFATLPCAALGTTPGWTGQVALVGFAKGNPSLAAFGTHFVLATLGGDDRGYIAMQRAVGPGEAWQGFEPLPAGQRGGLGMRLAEAPRLFLMSGAIVAAGRDRQTQELRAWVKYPNRLAPGDPWMGGRVVGGGGRSAMPAAMASLGRSRLWGMWDAPSELYVAAMGIGDRRVYGLNLGRWLARDVLEQDLSLDLVGMLGIAPQADRGLDPVMAPNYLEQMLTLLTLPRAARDQVTGTKCGSLTLATRLVLDRNYLSGQFDPGSCPWQVKYGTTRFPASTMFHEWLHMDAATRNIPAMEGFKAAFPFAGSGLDPAASGMRACTRDADCGGDRCQLAGDTTGGQASTRDYADDEWTIRRWDTTRVCVSAGGTEGRRPQGGISWYDVGTNDHAFIHVAIAYRWYGEDLRAWVQQDLARGNDQLQRRYAWVRDNYFGGVEYNGRLTSGAGLPGSDRSLGVFGMPDR